MTRLIGARTLSIACLLALRVAPPPALGQQPVDPPVGMRYALLVGVSRYDARRVRTLPFTEHDVNTIADVLRARGYEPQDVVMLTESLGAEDPCHRPTLANIRKEFAAMLRRCRPHDMVLVVLTGHGIQFRGDRTPYFLPRDADPGDATTFLSITELYEDLASCPASYKLLLVDACRDDSLALGAKPAGGGEKGPHRPPGSPTPGRGAAALLSCSPGQSSFDHDDLGHAIFLHFAIEGLKGAAADPAGRVTLQSLRDYLGRHVPAYVRKTYQYVEQEPQHWDDWPPSVSVVGPGPRRPQPASQAEK